jgi:quercetin 2,3-dioxygenase
MITLRKSNERGKADHGWLKSNFSFSFAEYYDPQHMGFRSLRVINDDVIAGGGGFPMHPHRDMEIISYVVHGALEHRDSMGNGSVIKPGEFQYMAAGTGVRHSEFNPSSAEPMRLLQIWITPDAAGYKPNYAEKKMTDAETGKLHLITSKSGREHSIAINQDADLYLAKLEPDQSVEHQLQAGRNAWLQVAEGSVRLNGQTLNVGDGAAISAEATLTLEGISNAQVLLFDLN